MKKWLLFLLMAVLAGCEGVNYPIEESLDKTAPQVVSANPANSETDVAPNRAVSLKFNEPIDNNTVGNSSFTVTGPNGGVVSGTYLVSGDTVTFTPDSTLSLSTNYKITVSSGVKDLAGNALGSDYSWSFTTGNRSDYTSPQVSSVAPANGATGVSVTAGVVVTFSEPVLASSVTSSSFVVSGTSGNVGGSIQVADATVTFTPTSALSYGSSYTVTIGTGVKDLAGNPLASNYTSTFTTELPAADTTPPQVVSTSPANGAVNVLAGSLIAVTFSEAVDQATVGIAVQANGSNVSGSLLFSNNTVTFTPSSSLPAGATCTVTVSGVKDLAGNLMNNYSFSFTTKVVLSAVSVSGGNWYSVAVRSDGAVKSWGDNSSGQLGNGSAASSNVPVSVNGLTNVSKVAAGYYHSLALKSDGTVWSWGSNGDGQLGDGSVNNHNIPVQVTGITGAVAVAGGERHSLVLKNDKTVWAWGYNLLGQLGAGGTGSNSNPVQVLISDVSAIAAGGNHSLALKSDKTVWAWGSNQFSQLGNGISGAGQYSSGPVQVSGLSDVIAIAAGENYSMALKSDGTVWAWGSNASGQLGDNSTTDHSTPVQVSGLSSVSKIAAGGFHALALKGDGTVWAWGSNQYGQLGDGTISSRKVPVQVLTTSGLSSATLIATGRNHSLAVKGDGTVWAWGYNMNGQLGIGNNTSWTAPAQVTGF